MRVLTTVFYRDTSEHMYFRIVTNNITEGKYGIRELAYALCLSTVSQTY